MITLTTAKRYQDLLGDGVAPSPYEYATLFEAKGMFARWRAKARFKLLKKIDAKLTRVLHAGERVYFVSKGSLAGTGEQFFAGSAAYYINLRALVFTTERVILMQIGSDRKPREIVSELPYTSIRKLKATWTGLCEVVLANGKKHRFSGMPKAERKFLGEFLSGVVSPENTTVLAKKSDGLVHLCPHCFTGVPDWPTSCGSCGGGIKSARTAALLSLAFPGLGDWYLGHRFFAGVEMVGTAFLWLMLVIAPLLGLALQEEGDRPAEPGFWAFSLIMVGGAHLIDAAVTHSFARKGHHPGKPPVISGPTAGLPTS